jgi:uncharacterized protein
MGSSITAADCAERPADGLAVGSSPLGPVAASERISSIDVLRGFSLLGILLLNIVAFGLPRQAYLYPTVAGGATGINLTVWFINAVLFSGKMRAIFSMLFGAGVIVLTSRAEQRGAAERIADIYYRRTLWLIAFGLLHAYFLWDGDILYYYGVAGLALYPLRKVAARWLIVAGVLVLAALVPQYLLEAGDTRAMQAKAAVADAAARRGEILTSAQQEDRRNWEQRRKLLKPTAIETAAEIAGHHKGYWAIFKSRRPYVIRTQSIGYYRVGFFDVVGMMLIGMGLLKLGIFSATCRASVYVWMAAAGYGLGVPLGVWVAARDVSSNFDLFTVTRGAASSDLTRLLIALAHTSLLMLVVKAGLFQSVISRLAAVGQMALSNYMLHSVVCTTLFYGYGFSLFGRMQRYQLYYFVLAIWTFQLSVSAIWLRYFRFGPLEWVWRSLTWWERQRMTAGHRLLVDDKGMGSSATS